MFRTLPLISRFESPLHVNPPDFGGCRLRILTYLHYRKILTLAVLSSTVQFQRVDFTSCMNTAVGTPLPSFSVLRFESLITHFTLVQRAYTLMNHPPRELHTPSELSCWNSTTPYMLQYLPTSAFSNVDWRATSSVFGPLVFYR